MQRWLVLSNCQTFGLANSLPLLNSTVSVDSADIWTYKADADSYNRKMSLYDRVIVHPDLATLDEFDGTAAGQLNHLPSIDFRAYHPDFGYFWIDGEFVSGPLAAYQSIIAVAAYNEGLGLADTRALYTARTYEAAGYHLDWAPERDALLRAFRAHGVELGDAMRRWGRSRAFMYSVNHPRIEALYDVARLFMEAVGVPTSGTDILPQDNLAAGPCPPVYPEVAERLGVRGSYLFKPPGENRYLSLDEFLRGSFAMMNRHPRGVVQPHPHYRPRYDSILLIIRGQA